MISKTKTSMSTQDDLKHFSQALQNADDAISSVLNGTSDELDLNSLQDSLSEAQATYGATLAPVETLKREFDLLRVDLTGRTLTMMRAINVALDKRSPESELALSEEIANSSAEELLRFYRRACVRFRDTFPGASRHIGSESASRTDWSEFKSQ